MGGAVIIGATVIAYVFAHVSTWRGVTMSGVLVLMLMTGLGLRRIPRRLPEDLQPAQPGPASRRQAGGAVGRSRSSSPSWRCSSRTRTSGRPASTQISFIRDTNVDLAFAGPVVGLLLFVVWAQLMISGWSNGVNLTDGLDGLATGTSVMVFAAYVLIGTWQSNQNCQLDASAEVLRGPRSA